MIETMSPGKIVLTTEKVALPADANFVFIDNNNNNYPLRHPTSTNFLSFHTAVILPDVASAM